MKVRGLFIALAVVFGLGSIAEANCDGDYEINGNGFLGTLQINGSYGSNFTGVLQYNGHGVEYVNGSCSRGSIQFFRAAGNQHYSGRIYNNHGQTSMEGTFTYQGGVYNWSAKESGSRDNLCQGRFSIVANGFAGEFQIERNGRDSISGTIQFNGFSPERIEGTCQRTGHGQANIQFQRYLSGGGVQNYYGTSSRSGRGVYMSGNFTHGAGTYSWTAQD